jgi:hypothetical protein
VNLFVLTAAPLQALSAFEAVQHFDIRPENSACLATRGALDHVRRLGLDLGPAHVLPYLHRGSAARRYLALRRCVRAARASVATGGRPTRLIIGFDGLLTRSIYWAVAAPAEVIVLEDGLASYNERSLRLRHGAPTHQGPVGRAVLRAFGLRGDAPPRAVHFTPFPLDGGGRDVVQHDFPALRRQHAVDTTSTEDVVLVLGTYGQDDDMVAGHLRRVVAQHPDALRLYKPHPSRAGESVPSGFSPLPTKEASLPAEMLLSTARPLPGHIYGFGSTALTTLRMLLPSSVALTDLTAIDVTNGGQSQRAAGT